MTTMIRMDAAMRQEMGRKGREKMIRQFDISQVIRIYDDAIRRFVR
jgi:hypothetical protein